jgi:hypothetical protein
MAHSRPIPKLDRPELLRGEPARERVRVVRLPFPIRPPPKAARPAPPNPTLEGED